MFDILDIQTRELSEIIKREKDKGNNLSIEERTIAILVRSNWQTDNILKEAKKRSVNIEIKSGGDLFQLESTQDLFKLILAIENAQNPVYLVNFIESNYTDLILDYQKFHGLSEKRKTF